MDTARAQVASLIDASPSEIIFTGSGTEADNLALVGTFSRNEPAHIVTSVLEHAAILETCRFLQGRGTKVDYLPVDSNGIVEPEGLRRILRADTRLVSVMTASNVIGTIQPVGQFAQITRLAERTSSLQTGDNSLYFSAMLRLTTMRNSSSFSAGSPATHHRDFCACCMPISTGPAQT